MPQPLVPVMVARAKELGPVMGFPSTEVLDEADRLLSLGFLPEVREIVSYLPSRPRDRQGMEGWRDGGSLAREIPGR